ncbi:protein-disulfide reductase DsbD family protein [Flavobacterium sp.]|uniref:protein-disulfide reductase DsbD family protein n=1 Tax=Flavobacterium sp. TaxID=239 RepID=UPI0028BEF84B|nr:cytochrome c biogenesis protein CcdA [Flavobacterium sp.]
MKRFYALLLLFFTFLSSQAQLLNPVSWKTSVEKKSDTEVVLVFDANIEHEWHMFSQFTPDGGSLPTVFNFKNAKGNFELVGKTKESPYKKVYSKDFEVDEYMFEGKAQFKQTVKITNPNLKSISVYVEYQVCKESCVQDDKTFEFKLPPMNVKPTTTTTDAKTDVATPVTSLDTATTETNTVADTTATSEVKEATSTSVEPVSEKEEKKSLWGIFILAFLGGFAALLTPCVFPMIPMTVSFFTKQSKTKAAGIRNAFIYGISIIVIYVGLGMIISAIFGIDSLNALSTNVWFNIIFFIILIVFAASFLGAFEIVLPNSFLNKIDRQADRGGVVGIFFMALALAVVSFSCTGPIVGSLLGESARQGGIGPIVGMLGFSSAIALPFMLFAMFPGWMNSLPKSGGWLNTVKVSLGFLELAFAFKFLSNADLVLQTHLLEREVFLAIWIAVFGAWALYLFGKLILPHDSPITHISVGRLFVALFVTTFTIYLIPGLWGAPLKILSGFTPPMTYSESPYGVGYQNNAVSTSTVSALPENAHIGPLGITAFHDYEQGLAYAKKVNKPVLLDFTGHACANCRKMEENVWSDAEILKILKNDIVLISLYGDDQRELPKAEQYVSKSGSEVTTIGKKWREFQIERYNINAQPYYVILDVDGKDISKPVGYTPDVAEYKSWLKNGIANFKK